MDQVLDDSELQKRETLNPPQTPQKTSEIAIRKRSSQRKDLLDLSKAPETAGDNMSEAGHYEKQVRRNNLVEFFSDEYEIDKYIAMHLYGEIADMSNNLDMSIENTSDRMNESAYALIKDLSTTFKKRYRLTELETQKQMVKKKFTPAETYFSLLKGYCAIAILIMPKAFVNGGWAASAALELASCLITTVCAAKLVQAGMQLKMFSYSLIVEKALGKSGRVAVDFMIAAT